MSAPEFRRWFQDNGDHTRLLDHDLNEKSVVFDIGGYTGEFTDDIFNKFGCNVYVFEPVQKFYSQLCERFDENNKVRIFNYGLATENIQSSINIDMANGENTSILDRKIIESVQSEKIFLKKIEDVFAEHELEQVDLISMNIEGGEYELLKHLVTSPVIFKIKNIQVQFHDFIDNARTKRDILHIKLQNTHKLTYNYDFVWENWKRRE
tara:strand:- start:749 stop:1372 length:624 start_codon:yes stop_codon:yes gene_type:complete